jgi:DNA integrity scanning protein DisA with diadenylate cyclase activity
MGAQKKIFPTITKLQTVEFAQVAVLVLIGFALYYKNHNLIIAALVVTLISLVVPKIFYPFAVGWFGLSKILSAVSSKILMAMVFLVIVVPVGFFRRLTGVDNLKIRQFKKSRQSVMVNRDHLYTEADFLNTF